jgi:pimeloyl-ACP methyl ester carboxylesterase
METNSSVFQRDNIIRLDDGRVLGYAEYGSPDGKALFYFHGHPGARVETKFLAEQAGQAGVRLIGIDRPGLGLSTYKKGRHLLDWPDDVIELADSLNIDHFAVVGFSGGGPYALACAYKLPHDRVSVCGVIAGVGHLNPFLSFLSQWLPWLLLPITKRLFQDEEQARKSLLRFSQNWIEADKKSLLLPGIKELMADSLVEALRQGAKGAAYDGMLLGRSWGFKIEDITFPRIHLWHGELDKDVPVTAAREIAAKLVQCKATYYPREGHISLIVNHSKEIISTLCG